MGIRFDGYRRLTFQFIDGWKGEDEHEFLGEFMILKCRLRQSANMDSVTVKQENASIRFVLPVTFQGATSSMPCEMPSPMGVAVSMTVVATCKPMPTCQDAKSVERGLLRFAATTTFK